MKNIFLFVFLINILSPAFSQKYGEAGLFIGGAFFNGDVYSDISSNTNITFGVDYRQNFNSRWAWRTDFKYGKVSGDDSNSDVTFELQRNLSFSNQYYQLGTYIEFNFLNFKPYNPRSYFQAADVFTPFVYIGLAGVYHNPKAQLAGNEYELKPLQTEGVSYSRLSVAVPFGIGFKFRVSDRIILSLSAELAPIFSDYIDDVSTRYPVDPNSLSKTGRDLSNRTLESQGPNSSSWGAQRGYEYNNDWLTSAVVTLNFNLKKNPSNCHFNPNK